MSLLLQKRIFARLVILAGSAAIFTATAVAKINQTSSTSTITPAANP